MQKLFVFTFFISLLGLLLIFSQGEDSSLSFIQRIGRKKIIAVFCVLAMISFFSLSQRGEESKQPIIIKERLALDNFVSDDVKETSASCFDINTAPKDDLVLIKHISDRRADDLIALRPFISLDDMARINGIGPARVEDIKDQGLACVN